MKPQKSRRGFTLIELIIIIIIISILGAAAIPKYLDIRRDAANAAARAFLTALRGANTIVWTKLVANGDTSTYSFGEVIAAADISGDMKWLLNGPTSVSLTVGSSSYTFTMNTYGSPPYTNPMIYGPYADW